MGVRVRALRCVKIQWNPPDAAGRRTFKEVPGSEFELKSDLVLLALGFVHIEHGPIVEELGLKVDDRGNLMVGPDFMTNVEGVFAAGDSVAGASLVVRAIAQGRQMADSMDKHLQNLARQEAQV